MRNRRGNRLLQSVRLLGLLAGLTWGGVGCQTPSNSWIRTELFFGLTTSNGTVIADSDWDAFLAKSIVPRFPEGLTVVTATGSWLNAQRQTQSEPSRMSVILYPANQSARVDPQIAKVTSEYIHQFAQESVLRSDTRATTKFYSRDPAKK